MQALRDMPDNMYDLAIVDPPYGINVANKSNDLICMRPTAGWKNPKLKTYTKKDWDTNRPSSDYFIELLRVSKKQVIWGGNYFSDLLPASGGWFVWDKDVSLPTFSQGELAWTNTRKSVDIVKLTWSGYRKCEQVDRIHPTQKPVRLYEWILDRYAKQGDRILDTHLGSGSIAVACHNTGHSLDAYEIDAEYFAAASARLHEHQRQIKLFT
jgi:site-specific DNA-methyltransferase (adenine-specific)